MNTLLHSVRLTGRTTLVLAGLACLNGPARSDTGANDWVAQQITVAPGGTSRVLWTNSSSSTGGQVAAVWRFDADGNKAGNGPVYGPYSAGIGYWVARQLVVAADGTSRLLWTFDAISGQQAVVWTLDANGNETSGGTTYGPYTDSTGTWAVRDLEVASDGTSRLLWTHLGSAGVAAIVWKLDASGKQTSGGTSYGPYSTTAGSWFPQQLAVASDGTSRLLWTVYGTTTSGTYSGDTFGVWTLDANGAKTNGGTVYGPTSGWAVNNFDLDTADNTMRVLLYNTSSTAVGDSAQVQVLNVSGTRTATGATYGPYAGWSATSLTALKDGTSRVQWQKDTTGWRSGGDIFSYWGFDSSGNQSFVGTVYGSYSGWTLGSFGFNATDGTFRLLWNRSDDAAGLWSLDAGGSQSSVGTVYGPYTY